MYDAPSWKTEVKRRVAAYNKKKVTAQKAEEKQERIDRACDIHGIKGSEKRNA